MRPVRRLFIIALLGACGEDAVGPTSYQVGGNWSLRTSLVNADHTTYCLGTTRLSLVQDGASFSGTGPYDLACVDPGGQWKTSGSATLTDGAISGTRISFRLDTCPFAGEAHGVLPDSVTGGLHCTLTIDGTNVLLEGSWRLAVGVDATAPVVTGSMAGAGANGIFELGDETLQVTLHATDDWALRTVGYELYDPNRFQVLRRDSVLVSGATTDDTLKLPLPLQLGNLQFSTGNWRVQLFASDTAGVTGYGPAFLTMPVANPSPPVVTGSHAGDTRDTIGALRDTLVISVSATSPRALRWLGYRLTNFVSAGESVAVTTTNATQTFRVPIPFAWKTLLLRPEIFTRDRLGLEDRRSLSDVRVVVRPSRPTQFFHLGQGVGGMVLDPVRGRVYLATAVDTGLAMGQQEIRVLNLAPAGYLPGIPFPSIGGFDVSVSGESLLVVQSNAPQIAVINLTTMVRDSIDLPIVSPSVRQVPLQVAAMANGKVMISVLDPVTFNSGPVRLLELTPGTGATVLRTDAGSSGVLGTSVRMDRSPDRQRLLIFSNGTASATGQLYRTAGDAFDPARVITLPVPGAPGPTADYDGSHWLVGNTLLAGDLSLLRVLPSAQPPLSGAALSADGQLAYIAVAEGIAKIRTADGVELERILLPDPPYRMLVTPDGTMLIGVGSPGLMVVDLR